MSELPEIRLLANQASHTLLHKTIQRVVVNQPKCLKESPLTFQSKLVGQQFVRCDYRGKYLCLAFGDHRLFLNFSMGGDFYFHENGQEWSEKYHLGVFFSDGSLLTLRNHWVAQYSICMNKTSHLSDDFGPNADHISLEQFICQANYCRATAKSFLLNQRRLAGIGNFYQHDILFLAKIHPASKMNVLNCSQLTCLHQVILSQLALSMSLGGGCILS